MSPVQERKGITLSLLARMVGQALAAAPLHNVWVIAELSDLRTNHGHCYMELMEKDPASGSIIARMRAAIWASSFPSINATFMAATGRRLESGLKVMVYGTVNFHPAFGMSFIISAIDPSYTMGEAERRRREIITRLTAERVINLNRELEWPDVPSRIAIISAPGAAGYGDCIHQLYTNPSRLRFSTRLFTAMMQGDRTSPSIRAALDEIAADIDSFDCVVIIRGGGATSDLLAFDDYELALNVAQFPLPVIIGIGHERDITVLDYVANMRVKTPTAAAEWLIGRGDEALARLRQTAADIMLRATDLIQGAQTHLAYLESTIRFAPEAALQRATSTLQRHTMLLAQTGARRIAPEFTRLQGVASSLSTAAVNAIARATDRLQSRRSLLEALSPQATLARGYSITTVDGRALRSAADLQPGQTVTTTLASGSVTSTVINSSTSK